MANASRSPIVGYKIALVNGANLNHQYVQIGVDAMDHPIQVKQFEVASKRMNRAIRKARIMRMSNRDVMLFGVRADGTSFPVSLRQVKWEAPKGNGMNAPFIVMPADHEAAVVVAKAARKAQAIEIRARKEA